MSVSREEAIYAYRLILGREPENEEVIVQAMAAENTAHLRQVFLGSHEFGSKYDKSVHRALPVGRYFDVSRVDIDIDCTPEQLQAMFDRIARAWQTFGETEPHWSVLVSEDYRQDKLEENIDRFYASGISDIDVHLNFLRRASLPTSFGKALDFGCGVGRLTLALAPHADQVVGVDKHKMTRSSLQKLLRDPPSFVAGVAVPAAADVRVRAAFVANVRWGAPAPSAAYRGAGSGRDGGGP